MRSTQARWLLVSGVVGEIGPVGIGPPPERVDDPTPPERVHPVVTSEANNAVRTIRSVKAQLKARFAQAGARGVPLLDRLGGLLRDSLSTVEAEIYQVKNRSGQDPLNYPIKLNNQLGALAGVVGGTEAKPTAPSREVFSVLSAALDKELGKMKVLLDGRLGAVNAELARLGLEPIKPSTDEE